jgi:hypothetical protein
MTGMGPLAVRRKLSLTPGHGSGDRLELQHLP